MKGLKIFALALCFGAGCVGCSAETGGGTEENLASTEQEIYLSYGPTAWTSQIVGTTVWEPNYGSDHYTYYDDGWACGKGTVGDGDQCDWMFEYSCKDNNHASIRG